MKYSDIADESYKKDVLNSIAEHDTSLSEWRNSAVRRITNYLFVLNTGGLLATISYAASTSKCGASMVLPVTLFSAGTLSVLAHAAIDYYTSEQNLSSYRKKFGRYYKDEIDWQELWGNGEEKIDWLEVVLHLLGWGSALVFVFGLYCGYCLVTS